MGTKVLNDTDRIYLATTKEILNAHVERYFGSTEVERRQVLEEIERAEREHFDIVASSPELPGDGQWRLKWPAAARAAALALWHTPR